MIRKRVLTIWIAFVGALTAAGRSDDAPPRPSPVPEVQASTGAGADSLSSNSHSSPTDFSEGVEQAGFAEALTSALHDHWVVAKPESAKFDKANQIPGTEIWWKFGGYIKGDFIHDFQPAGTPDRWVPTTIPVDGSDGQNTLMQAKATRLNLDVRAPSDWGTIRGFVETDFFTNGNQLRIRHAYAEVGHLLAGQTWTVFTDPDGIPRTLDFESPIAFIVQRQAQFRWTEELTDNLKWATSIENPTTAVDDVVTATIPGDPAQPIPDLATHLKYKSEYYEWFVAGLFRDVAYRPDTGSEQDRFGCAINIVGILKPTKDDKIIGQFVAGNGLGRYRGGSDLRLASPGKVEPVDHMGGCLALTHAWTETLSSTGVYSVAVRRRESTDPGDTPQLANYVAANVIWAPIDNTTLGVEYLYGSNEVHNGDFGEAHRIQATVQYNFP
ncbi:Porin subfamily protein [Caulifigura coniformis]|uniref:Porin subfamily protein n=1 Tax=Caulifigura coniformis TaxID=2527983 RepID=A0A517SIH2_9PLAN|nr:DcaP family trimeric outer membrane transporter [Caulifigura coniformis]QDT55928.1 Porin subfamily protein [Caulifigura coniformis]